MPIRFTSDTPIRTVRFALLLFCILVRSPAAIGQEVGHRISEKSYSPYGAQHYPSTVYWGDTHLHTNYSVDAYVMGNRISPEQAYRFARGEAMASSSGMRVRLRRPLDFLAVADHAESLGWMVGFESNDPALLGTEAGKRIAQRFNEHAQKRPLDSARRDVLRRIQRELAEPKKDQGTTEAVTRSVWKQVSETADRYNDPGRFTAFIGYEWTSPGQRGLAICIVW